MKKRKYRGKKVCPVFFCEGWSANSKTLALPICRLSLKEKKRLKVGALYFPQKIEKKSETIVDKIKGGVMICNVDSKTYSSKVVYINKGWTDITGYTMEQLNQTYGGNPQALIFPEDKARTNMEYTEQMLLHGEYDLIYRIKHKSGQTRWVIDKGSRTTLSNGTIQNQSILTEVTKIKEQEERLRLLAQTDQLTQLNNKITFSKLAQKTLNCQCHNLHAMMIMDIDNFKNVNDRYGHVIGDKLLEIVAIQLKEIFRYWDILGRVGGDEFMILMTDIDEKGVAERKAREICTAMRGIKFVGNEDFQITVSVGITFFMKGKTYETLFDEADMALYRAKNKGKDRYEI